MKKFVLSFGFLVLCLISSNAKSKTCELAHVLSASDIGVVYQEDTAPSFKIDDSKTEENFDLLLKSKSKQVIPISHAIVTKKNVENSGVLFNIKTFRTDRPDERTSNQILFSKDNINGSIGHSNDIFESKLHINCY